MRFSGVGLVLILFIYAPSCCAATQSPTLSATQAIHYTPWFAKDGSTKEVADAIMAGRYRPYKQYDDWMFGIPIPWEISGTQKNWLSVLHSLYMLDPLMLQHKRDGNAAYLRRALEIVRDWHRFHFVEGRSSEFSWTDATVGIRSAKIAWLYGALGAQKTIEFSDEDRLMLRQLAISHISLVLDGTVKFRMTNHGLFQIHGLVTVCHVFQIEPLCSEARAFAKEKLDALLQAQFDREGIHIEHSPAYHQLAIRLIEFFAATRLYDDAFPELIETTKTAKSNLFWLTDPNHEFWRIGDTWWGEVVEQWRSSYPHLSCDDQQSSLIIEGRCYVMRAFDYGYVSIKSVTEVPADRGSGLFIQGAFHSKIHKHLDDLSFELFEAGTKVLVDAGNYGYEQSPERRYVLSTRAHNTVEIGAKDFSRTVPPYRSALRKAEVRGDHFYVEAVAPHPDLGAIHYRQFLYRPGEWLIIKDRVISDRDRKIVQWFHFHPDAALGARDGNRISLSLSERHVTLENTNACPSTVRKGRKEPRLDGWHSPSGRTLIPNYAIGFICDGGLTIETKILLGKD